MRIFNAIWLDNHLDPVVESFKDFNEAVAHVKQDLKNYKYSLNTEREEVDYYFARIEDIVEVEIVATEVR